MRLRIFFSSTCVGLRYGHLKNSLVAFLVSVTSVGSSSKNRISPATSGYMSLRICLKTPPRHRPYSTNGTVHLAYCVPTS